MKYCAKCGYQMTDDMMFCQKCGTKFETAKQVYASSNTCTERITMNKQMGTKWFTFYTKVRPWLGCIFCLPSFIELATYPEVFVTHPELLLSVFATGFVALLSIVVFVKSKGDYSEFVDFVKIALIAETISIPYNLSIQKYYEYGENLGDFLIFFVVLFLLSYFIWYRLNMKYFKNRLLQPMPITHSPVQHSLSNIGETQKQYGNYNISGNDIAYTPAPEQQKRPL